MRVRALLCAAIAAETAGLFAIAALRHRAFNTGRFDMGNMVQGVWATAHGSPLEVTNLDGEQVSRLGSHFDPILAVFGPLWWLWPSADLLLLGQALVVSLGAVPVFLLARKHLGTERAGLGFAIAYLLYPATQWLVLNEFHPVALAPTLLLFAYWHLDEGQFVRFALFAVAAVCCKEEIGLVVAAMGLGYGITRRRWRLGAGVAAAGLAASVIAVEVVVPHFHGAASSFYSRYSNVGGSPGGVLETAVTHPLRFLGVAFSLGNLQYLWHLLFPLGFLFVLSPWLALAAAPELALNLLSDNAYQRSVYFHYTAGIVAPLMVAAVLGGARIARRHPRLAPWVAPALVVVAVIATYRLGAAPVWRALPGGESYQATYTHVTDHDRAAEAAARLVPADAVVSTTNWLGGHLSARRRILSFPRLDDATWVVVDETSSSYLDRIAPLPTAVALRNLRRNPAWALVWTRDGIAVFRRTS